MKDLDFKNIDFSKEIAELIEKGVFAGKQGGMPPHCNDGYILSKDGTQCIPEDSSAKTKEQYEKIDTKELKRDDKKEKKEHEKDALKDDADKIKKLKKGKPSEKKSVEIHDIKKDEKYDKAKAAKLSSKEKSNLPDSDFAYIQPGGKKDSEGKTVPRSLRHLPINDAAHVRNALARLDQTDISPEAKKAALKKIKAAAKKFGIKVSEASATIDYSDLY